MNYFEMKRKFERLIVDFLNQEDIPEEERFDGLVLAMAAHGLPCDPQRVRQIRKYWQECVAARRQPHKKP